MLYVHMGVKGTEKFSEACSEVLNSDLLPK